MYFYLYLYLHFTFTDIYICIYYAGHSRTIIGLEELNDGNLQLLVFDPSHSKSQMEQFNSTSLNSNAMRLIRRPLSALKARQYQLVYVDGILDSEDEYQVIYFIIIRNDFFLFLLSLPLFFVLKYKNLRDLFILICWALSIVLYLSTMW